MEAPLWIERHQPALSDLPQPEVRRYLRRVPDGPTNLLLHGPAGSGKSAAVYALAEELHDDPENDLMTINIADFFGMTKKELVDDPRFSGFIQSGQRQDSKASLVNHILQEMAGYPPISGNYKTILLDNAEAMRPDFQQALRRVMERHYAATQFVLTTREAGAILDALRSRCVPVPVRAPTTAEIVVVLEQLVETEGVGYEKEGLEYVAEYAEGDLRRAILGAQATAVDAGEITMTAAYEALDGIGSDDQVIELLDHAEAGEFTEARKLVDDLLIKEGYDGSDILDDILRVAGNRHDPERRAAIVELAGDIEFDLVRGTSDRVQLGHFLSRLAPDVPDPLER